MDITNHLPYLSSVIKENRLKLGLKQSELAKTIGIGLKTLRKIEQGDLTVNFVKLSYLLNCLGLSLVPSDLVTSPIRKNSEILSKKFILQTLKHIYPILKIKYGVSELALFGSYALEEAQADSDIDILIEFEAGSSFETEGEIQLILENLFKGAKVDLTIKSNLNEAFKKMIEETKIDVPQEL